MAFCLPSRTCYLTGQYLFHNRQYGFTGLLPEDQAYMPAGLRLTCIPFDEVLRLERKKPDAPHNCTEWNYDEYESRMDLHRLTDELIDYICTKIRPVSIMVGNQEARDNMLTTRGHGLC